MTDQSSSIIVEASATPADGVGAHFKLLVDGAVVGDATVSDRTPTAYTFKADLDPAQPHAIAIQYDNDAVTGTGDRNLFVRSVTLNGTALSAKDQAVTYKPDYGLPARTGTGDLYWGGTLVASFPAAKAATTPAATPVAMPVAPPVITAPAPAVPAVPSGTVGLVASGTAAGGVSPHFLLLVDGTAVADGFVADGPAQTMTVTTPLDPTRSHLVSVRYDNDGTVNGADRNLFVQAIQVNGVTYRATDSLAVYHANGQGDIKGSGALYWGGTLDFAVPVQPATPTVTVAPTPVLSPTLTPVPAPTPASSSAGSAAAEASATRPGFYVAVFGSDNADGSASHPFATLDRARMAMEGSTLHTTYVLGGTYAPSAPLVLGKADSGTAYIAAPGDTPVLDGRNSLSTLVTLDGASGVTLQGLSFTNTVGSGTGALSLKGAANNSIVANTFANTANGIVLTGSSGNLVLNNALNRSAQSAVEAKDGSDGNTFASNSIDGTGAIGQSGGGFFLHGASNNTITHNLVQNTAGVGIGIENWDATTINVGNTVSYNVVRNTSTRSEDSGAIYILGRSHVDTKAVVANNLVDTTGASGAGHTIGIYLDDSTTGVTVRDNVVTGLGTHGVEIHGGDDITVTNNIFDLGRNGTSAVLFQAAPADTNPRNTMLGNLVTGNVILAGGSGQSAYTSLDGGHPTIVGNLYAGLTPAQVTSTLLGDTAPAFGSGGSVDGSSGRYQLPSGSGAINLLPIDTSAFGVQPLPAAWAR